MNAVPKAALAAMLVLMPIASAHADPVSVALLQPDAYATRGVVVTKTDGTSIRGVLGITAYDRTARSFVLETAGQGPVTVPASGIRGFAFSRSLHRSSPMAQTCPSEVVETAGPAAVVEIAAGDLRIDGDRLEADAPGLKAPVGEGSRVEVRSLDYDARKELFHATLQTIAYRIETAPCGGKSSIGGKQLQ